MSPSAVSLRNRVVRAAIDPLESRDLFASISAVTPFNGQQSVAASSNIDITFGSAMTASTLTASQVTLRDAAGKLVANALTYSATTRKLTIDPTANLSTAATYYTIRVAGGTGGVKATDGSSLASDFTFGFSCGKPTVSQQPVINGLNTPMNVEFAADGRVFVAEKSGIIKAFDNLSDTTATVLADLRTNVHNFWDRGLLGMALDPKFTTGRPYVYVLYTADSSPGVAAPKWGTANADDDPGGSDPIGAGTPVTGKLSRLTIGANGIVGGSELVLINDWNQQFPSHSIGDLKFGPDGYLYASAGDGASFNAVDSGQFGNPFGDPTNEGGALRSQDILSDGDAAGLNGSVIRINPDTGAAAPGNPFAASGDANKQKVIANGLRNPFRITFKPGTKELWVAETGWNTYEEINRIVDATDAVAENFGWPAYEGPGVQNGYKSANLPLLQQLYNNPSLVTSPWFSYAHSAQVVAGSGEPTGGSSPTGIAFYNGTSYPSVYNGALFFADFSRARVYVMHVGPNGAVDPASRQVVMTGTFVEITEGPGGDLYAVDINAGRIVRLVPPGYNRAPVAAIAADKTSGGTPLTVKFNTVGTNDPDGGALTYAFDLDGDGLFTVGTDASPSFTYTKPGDVTASVRVTDAGGLTGTASIVIHVANVAPVPTIASPVASLKWSVGQTVSFAGSAFDADEGTLAASKLTWDLILVHGSADSATSAHEHKITSFAGVAGGSFIAPDHEYPSWLVLRLTATDSAGVSGTTEVRIDPRTIVLTFSSNVAKTSVGFNDEAVATPFSRTVIAGSTNSLSAPGTQTTDNGNFVFSSWSQGGTAAQTFTAPQGDTVFTATYVTTAAAPSAPINPSVAIAGARSVEFSWIDTSNNETGFVIQRRYRNWIWSDLVTVGAGVTKYVDNSVAASTAYEYRVAATNAAGVSAWTNAVVADTANFATSRPAAPSNLASTLVLHNRVDLKWTDNSGNETSFVVNRRVANSGAAWEIAGLADANVTTFSDLTVGPDTSYEYNVVAQNIAGVSNPTSSVVVRTASATTGDKPAVPGTVTALQTGFRAVRINWLDTATNETSFIVQRRYAGWVWEDLATVGAGVTTYTDLTPYVNATYEYRVIAANAAGQSAAWNGATVAINP